MCTTTQPGKISRYLAGDYYVLSEKEFGSLISKFTLGFDGQVSGDLEFLFKTLNIPDRNNYPTVKWSMDERGSIALFFCNEHVCKYQSRISLYGISEDNYKVSAVYNNYTDIVKRLQFADQKVLYPFVKNTNDYESILKIKKEIDDRNNLAGENQVKLQKSIDQLLKGINKDDIYSFTLLQDERGRIVGNDEYYKFIQAYFNNYENPDISNSQKLGFDEFEFNSRKKDYHKILQQKYILIKLESMEKLGVNTFDFKKNSYVFENFGDLFYTFGNYKDYELHAIADSYVNSTGYSEFVFLLKYNKSLLLKMSSQVAKSFQDNYLIDKKLNSKIGLYILVKVIKTEINQYRNRTNIFKYEIPSFNTVSFKQVIVNPIKALAIDKTNNERIFLSE